MKKIPLLFYCTETGKEIVREWLLTLEKSERHAIGSDLLRSQHYWPIGMPLCRPMGGGLWEIRTSLPTKRIARVFICFHAGTLYVLHGFIKKTQKTPLEDLSAARKRQKEIERG